MPHCTTKYFGTISYEESAVLHFPSGLPGFEIEHRFLSLEQPGREPLVFLQSLSSPDLCFVALPARAVAPSYELEMEDADLASLELETTTGEEGWVEVGCDYARVEGHAFVLNDRDFAALRTEPHQPLAEHRPVDSWARGRTWFMRDTPRSRAAGCTGGRWCRGC